MSKITYCEQQGKRYLLQCEGAMPQSILFACLDGEQARQQYRKIPGLWVNELVWDVSPAVAQELFRMCENGRASFAAVRQGRVYRETK